MTSPQPRHNFQRNSGVWYAAVSVVGNTAATGLSAVALILVSRWLGPEQFGWFSVMVALSILVGKIADVGLNAAVVKFVGQTTQEAQIKAVIWSVWRVKLLVSLFLVLVASVSYRQVARVLGLSQDGWVWWALIGSVGIVWYEQLIFSLQGLHRFVPAVLVNAIQATTKLGGVIVLWFWGGISRDVALAIFLVAPAVPWMASRWLLPEYLWKGKSVFRRQTHFRMEKVWRMARHTAVLAVSLAVIENVDLFFVQRFTNQVETGLFAGAWRIAMLVMLMGYSLGSVLNPRLSRFTTRDLQLFFFKALGLCLGLGLVYLVMVPLLPWVISLSIGSEYLNGASMLTVLLGAAFLMVGTVPFAAYFYNWDAPWYFSLTAAWQIAVIVLGNWWFVPQFGAAAAGWVRVTAQGTVLLFTVLVVWWRLWRSHALQRL